MTRCRWLHYSGSGIIIIPNFMSSLRNERTPYVRVGTNQKSAVFFGYTAVFLCQDKARNEGKKSCKYKFWKCFQNIHLIYILWVVIITPKWYYINRTGCGLQAVGSPVGSAAGSKQRNLLNHPSLCGFTLWRRILLSAEKNASAERSSVYVQGSLV